MTQDWKLEAAIVFALFQFSIIGFLELWMLFLFFRKLIKPPITYMSTPPLPTTQLKEPIPPDFDFEFWKDRLIDRTIRSYLSDTQKQQLNDLRLSDTQRDQIKYGTRPPQEINDFLEDAIKDVEVAVTNDDGEALRKAIEQAHQKLTKFESERVKRSNEFLNKLTNSFRRANGAPIVFVGLFIIAFGFLFSRGYSQSMGVLGSLPRMVVDVGNLSIATKWVLLFGIGLCLWGFYARFSDTQKNN
ncbi:MAG TPA: hypothetical protein PLQ88_03555 [Blastocatellia bacterium]|nr:hypothetical protein [Blastocatellia bacterium]HMY70883.1 hypothetical protein [Blastocatellia bacterium]